MVDQRSFFSSYFSFLYGRRLVLYLLLIYYIDLVRLTVILFGRYNWQMVATKKFTMRCHVFVVYLTLASRDSPARTVYLVKLSRLAGCPAQVDRVPQVGRLPCLACKCFYAISKDTYTVRS